MPIVAPVDELATQVGHTQGGIKCPYILSLSDMRKNRTSIMWNYFTFHESGYPFYVRTMKLEERTTILL
jgi:hypothetical protein